MTKIEKQKEITKRILSAGGKVVHVVGDEAEVDMIMEKGQLFDGATSIVEGGEHMLCHNNSLKFYLENEGMRLCTGYAANESKDGDYMWVNHSWCIDKDGIIHECTPVKRDKYYGAIMDEREAERFRRGIDFQYDAECKRREELEAKSDNETKVEEPNQVNRIDVETLDFGKGIKGWMKRMIYKIRSKRRLALVEARVPETAEQPKSLIETLQGSINEDIEYNEIEDKGEKIKETIAKEDATAVKSTDDVGLPGGDDGAI